MSMPPKTEDALSRTLAPPKIDWTELNDYRMDRIRQAMAEADVDLAIVTNPLTMRYAVNYHEYMPFQARIPLMMLMIFADGPVVFSGAFIKNLDHVTEYVPTFGLAPFFAGFDQQENTRRFVEFVRSRMAGKGRARIGVDRLDASAVQGLMQAGFEVSDAPGFLEKARSIKCAEEVQLVRYAIAVAELGIARMRDALKPGLSENELWSILGQINVAHGGLWSEARMLASGERTNPWLQEAGDRRIESGDLIGFDTDMVGPFGYMSDISRTWYFGDGKAPDVFRDLFKRALDEIEHNKAMVRPGVSFRELTENSFRHPEEFHAHRYPCIMHGVGMCDEYPFVPYPQDWDHLGYDGVIEENMMICVEGYVGSDRGGCGVKIEHQFLVTASGLEQLDIYPYDEKLLS